MIETEADPVRSHPSCHRAGPAAGRWRADEGDPRCRMPAPETRGRCRGVFRDGDGFLSGFQVKVRFF